MPLLSGCHELRAGERWIPTDKWGSAQLRYTDAERLKAHCAIYLFNIWVSVTPSTLKGLFQRPSKLASIHVTFWGRREGIFLISQEGHQD